MLLAVSGCQRKSAPIVANAPIPEVRVARAVTQNVIDYREFTGRTSAVDSVEIRARVSGYLLQSPRSKQTTNDSREAETKSEIVADEGKMVQAGDLLFQIDPKPYELALQQSKGALDASEARMTQASQDLSRSDELLEKKALSLAEYDKAIASVAELRGQIVNLKATVARNQLDLDYTRVYSPITGLLGRTLVTNGNLVAADSTILTTVVSVDPIYVDFDVDEQSVLDYRSRILGGEVKSARDVRIPIRLGLSNEDDFPHEGYIDFVNNTTDPGTGSTRIRGVFDNASEILSPGLFARIQVPFTAEYEAILIPTTAIGMDQQGRFVMVVSEGNKVQRRSVTLGQIKDDMTGVRKGIAAGEIVVTSGLQKIRPGSEVLYQETPLPAAESPAPASNNGASQ